MSDLSGTSHIFFSSLQRSAATSANNVGRIMEQNRIQYKEIYAYAVIKIELLICEMLQKKNYRVIRITTDP